MSWLFSDRGLLLIGGVVLAIGALIVVERYDLYRKNPMKPVVTSDDNRLPVLAAGSLAIGAAVLIFLGLRTP